MKPKSLGPAIVLLSGGMDSATVLALAKERGHHPIYALSVSYGQRHAREVRSARALSRYYGAKFVSVKVSLAKIAPSALTRRSWQVPSGRSLKEMGKNIPSTYVPARNSVMLSLALSLSESARANAIYLGINAIDYSGYPDCRPEFLAAFKRMAKLATARGTEEGKVPEIVAPLLHMTKADIVEVGDRLGVPWERTWSCYRGGRNPCGTCDSCLLRKHGFEEASKRRRK